MKEIIIRENIDEYMRELKLWLDEEKDTPIERMTDFFSARVEGYEEHMSVFFPAYDMLANALPKSTKTLLDIGCGTGLELERIFARLSDVHVTGIDLSEIMLAKLREKFPGRAISLVCADYFAEKFPGEYDAVISFETLHHFKAAKKLDLFKKLYSALKPGGTYIECDYIACCDEEEALLLAESQRKRKAAGVAENVFVHFDTPFTAEHELSLLHEAGFKNARLADCVCGVAMIIAEK